MVKMIRGSLVADVHETMVEDYKKVGYVLYEEPKKETKETKVEPKKDDAEVVTPKSKRQ